jgi:septal ring-binding cell division protein DamX
MPPAGAGDEELTAVLDREVRSGARSYRQPRGRSRAGLVAGIVVGALVAASVAVVLLRRPEIPPSGETMPAGTEEVLPAETDAAPQSVGDTEPAAPSGGGEAEPAPPIPATPEPPDAAEPDMRGIVPSAPTPDTPFRVHVASFKSEEKVQQMVRQLRLRGADAWYESAANASGYYRVFVGHFATEAEARAHAQWLLDNGWVDRAQAYPATTR